MIFSKIVSSISDAITKNSTKPKTKQQKKLRITSKQDIFTAVICNLVHTID